MKKKEKCTEVFYQSLTHLVKNTGVWDGEQSRTHFFLLSPDAYSPSRRQIKNLNRLGESLNACLIGIGNMATDLFKYSKSNNPALTTIIHSLKGGIPKTYHDIMLLYPNKIPKICKVDIIESIEGDYKIAEIDGHNKHGMGYSLLSQKIKNFTNPKSLSIPNIAFTIAEEIKNRNKKSFTLLYGTQEIFYLPEFLILKKSLAEEKITMNIVCEDDKEVIKKIEKEKLLLDFPFLHRNTKLNIYLQERYTNNSIEFLIPPKPFMGSKSLLAILRNDTKDLLLEHLLNKYIKKESLNTIRKFIPETFLITKSLKKSVLREQIKNEKFVLKNVISSGAKGIFFPKDKDYEKAYTDAWKTNYQYVLQKEVTNKPFQFNYFNEIGQHQKDIWFIRITMYYTNGKIGGAKVAARKNKLVHGARDCLQLGIILP